MKCLMLRSSRRDEVLIVEISDNDIEIDILIFL